MLGVSADTAGLGLEVLLPVGALAEAGTGDSLGASVPAWEHIVADTPAVGTHLAAAVEECKGHIARSRTAVVAASCSFDADP
jgi:hypothetical protein